MAHEVIAEDQEDDHGGDQGVQGCEVGCQAEVFHELDGEGVEQIDRQGIFAHHAHHRELPV